MGPRIFAFALMFFAQSTVFAEIPGTARSNERDVVRLDAGLGLSSPSPGLSAGISALRTFKPAHAFGLALNFSHHNLSEEYKRINTQAYDLIWEYSLALFEGFHALRLRGGMGAANSLLKKQADPLGHRAAGDGRHVWLGHAMASVAFDIPQADLMWMRCGIWGQRAFSKDFPFQVGVFVGWVLGGQWVGVGD